MSKHDLLNNCKFLYVKTDIIKFASYICSSIPPMLSMSLSRSDKARIPQGFDTVNGDERVVLSYKGAVTEDLISQILHYIEGRFTQFPTTARVRRKIVSVLVEAMQNIFRHGPKMELALAEKAESEVTVYRCDDDYLVVTGNRVESAKAFDLKARIDRINAMSKEELNASYRHILETKAKTSPNGSGVGIIDIARRTGNQIEFSMEKVGDNSYFCSMQIKIGA